MMDRRRPFLLIPDHKDSAQGLSAGVARRDTDTGSKQDLKQNKRLII